MGTNKDKKKKEKRKKNILLSQISQLRNTLKIEEDNLVRNEDIKRKLGQVLINEKVRSVTLLGFAVCKEWKETRKEGVSE